MQSSADVVGRVARQLVTSVASLVLPMAFDLKYPGPSDVEVRRPQTGPLPVDGGEAGGLTTPSSPATAHRPDGEQSGPAARRATPKRGKHSPVLLELSLVAFLIWIYSWLQDLAPLRRAAALAHAAALLSFEHNIGLGPEKAFDHWLAHEPVLAYITSSFYDWAIFLVTFGFACVLWWRRPDIYRPLRNVLVLANLIAFGVFWAYPVAPPRMLPGFVDVVAKLGGLGAWHNTLIRHADQLAAMPSMHLGYAAWSVIVAWRLARSDRARVVAVAFGVIYLFLTGAAVIATGNHYMLDVFAGIGTTLLALAMVEVLRDAVRRQQVDIGDRREPAYASGKTEP